MKTFFNSGNFFFNKKSLCVAAIVAATVFSPMSHAKGLIFITHGWNANAREGWVNGLLVKICSKVGSGLVYHDKDGYICSTNNWDVRAYDWSEDAKGKEPPTTWTSIFDIASIVEPIFGNPSIAVGRAIKHGQKVASQLKDKNYTHIQFIAHSAGSQLIQTASQLIKANKRNSITIHTTFLDAFDPSSKSANYGEWSDFSEHYFDSRPLTFLETLGMGSTKVTLSNTYNINVTNIGDGGNCGNKPEINILDNLIVNTYKLYKLVKHVECIHSWPANWYVKTVTNKNPFGYGFALSLESPRPELLNHDGDYKRGRQCKLTDHGGCPNPNLSYNNGSPKNQNGDGKIATPSVMPDSGIWASSPQFIKVTANNAGRIYCTLRTDNTTPSEPTTTSFDSCNKASKVINGSSGNFEFFANPGQNKTIKVRFRAYKNGAFGPTSPVYTYSINNAGTGGGSSSDGISSGNTTVGDDDVVGKPPVIGDDNAGKLPDLAVKKLAITDPAKNAKSTFKPGEAMLCRVQAKNKGKKKAGAFTTACYLSKGKKIDKDPNLVGVENTKGLDHKGDDTHTESIQLTAPNKIGLYSLTGCVDYGKSVAESNEKNNCSDEEVFEVVGNPNVLVTVMALGNNKTSLQPGENYRIDVNIQNNGDDFNKDIRLAYLIKGGQYGDALKPLDTDNMKPKYLKTNAAKSESLEAAIAPMVPGQYTLYACADYTNVIAESNETDNCKSMVITVTAGSTASNKEKTAATLAVINSILLSGNQLSVIVQGQGQVTSNPSGIQCQANQTCAVDFDGDKVLLTAKPSATGTFLGWYGDCKYAGTNPVCTVNMQNDSAVKAIFK